MRSGHYCFQFMVEQATVHIVRLTANVASASEVTTVWRYRNSIIIIIIIIHAEHVVHSAWILF